MRKPVIALLFATGGVVSGHAAVADNIFCNFSQGIPADFTLLDRDGNVPSRDVALFGFEKGSAWITRYIESDNNFVAASTSWYDPQGSADDWMILPPLKVGSDSDILSWRAMATDKRFRDGYSVYVSLGGDSPKTSTRSRRCSR